MPTLQMTEHCTMDVTVTFTNDRDILCITCSMQHKVRRAEDLQVTTVTTTHHSIHLYGLLRLPQAWYGLLV